MDILDTIFLISAFVLVLTATAILTNISINNKFKKQSLVVCLTIFFAALCEWIGYKLGNYNESVVTLRKIIKTIEYCLTPFIAFTAALAYSKLYHKKTTFICLIVHVVTQIIFAHFDLTIYFSDGNNYYHGKMYWLYIVVFCVSGLGLFISVIREEFRLYKTMEPILIETLLFIAAGLAIQMIKTDLRIDYLCVSIGNYFLFAHRTKMIMQMDGLTELYNRKCFEEHIKSAKPSIGLIVMDLNKFKQINDTYGHRVGDESLKKIANILLDTYNKYGTCYRIGGDEFAVIMSKKLEDIEEINKSFNDKINAINAQDERVPIVAVGYTIYDDKQLLVDDALKIADKHMFEVKRNEESTKQ